MNPTFALDIDDEVAAVLIDTLTRWMNPPIDVTNDYFVGATAYGRVTVLRPPVDMDREEALRLAAWLVAIADISDNHERFNAVLEAVERT